MVKALPRSAASIDALNTVLDRWQIWLPNHARKPVLEKSLRGKSNDNYLVISGAEKFVVRINSDNHALGVDRNTESVILRNIVAEGFAPIVVWQDENCLITRFVEGEHPNPAQIHEWLPRLGRLYKEIHATPSTIKVTLDPLKHAVAYFSQIEAPVDPRIARCLEQLLVRPEISIGDLCLCHNDLLCENIVRTEETWIAIDWEYGKLGDPAFDIAVFVETMNIDQEQQAALISAYGSSDIVSRIPYYRDLYRLIEILWWLLRDPGDAGHEKRIETLSRRLASPVH